MITNDNLNEILDFLCEYASRLMSCGVHTSRVVRNTQRIARSQGIWIAIQVFRRHITISASVEGSKSYVTRLVQVPKAPISFSRNSSLSSLSWLAYDNHPTLDELKEKYAIILEKPKLSPYLVLVLVSLANMSFCKLFGGEFEAMMIVLVCTAIGFFLKQKMGQWKSNAFSTFIMSSFVASVLCAAASNYLLNSEQTLIAMSTSILYLIPGVPLVNGVIDIIEGHILIGSSRLIDAMLLIFSIAVGLGMTLSIFHDSLL
ncbi:MAG: threonine/serine exporter family protein [Bacteroidaceae bacterium]